MKNQRIYSGTNSHKKITAILQQENAKKVLLVCGKSFDSNPFRDFIESQDIPFVRFMDFSPNPKYEGICKGVKRFKKEECDFIMAIGGGSAMDVAKCIKLFSVLDENKNYLEQDYRESTTPLLAFPTTAGTGSESTRYAAIYYQGEKQSVTQESIIPDYVILEPAVLQSVPDYHKKAAYLDALCQGIESWWSVNSTVESQKLSKGCVEVLISHFNAYFEDDADSLEVVQRGANLSGQAINLTQTTAAHAMGYKLTSLYGIAHGHAVALCLPRIWDYMSKHLDLCVDRRGKDYLSEVFEEIARSMGVDTPQAAIEKLDGMIQTLGLTTPEVENDGQLKELVSSVNPLRLGNNPVRLDDEAIEKIYRKVLMGK